MTLARHQQVSLQDTRYYHCISRCVRRAYLCGDDPVSGRNFDHRKVWLVSRIKQLAAQFAVDVCAYAVMSNHYHLVLFVNTDVARSWSDDEVIARWVSLFPGNAALVATLQNNSESRAARSKLKEQVALWRERLSDISWFMRCLNENVARRANREDECTGRFWEGRFKSQALLDDKALISCMAYVDLNPVRAGIADNLEGSDFTSIQERLLAHARRSRKRSHRQKRLLGRRSVRHLLNRKAPGTRAKLAPMSELGGAAAEIPIRFADYAELLENTCKALRTPEQSRGAWQARPAVQSTLEHLGIHSSAWLDGVKHFHRHFGLAAGSVTALADFHCNRIVAGVSYKHPNKWIRGSQSSRNLFT